MRPELGGFLILQSVHDRIRIESEAGMNARQQRFTEEFLQDANAKQAAIRAGYSAKSAEVNGPRLLRNAQVAAVIAEKQKERSERLRVTADMVVQELALHAFGLIGDFYDKSTGKMLEVHEMPPEAQARLSSIKLTRERTHTTGDGVGETIVNEATIELKVWDKIRSLELLGKHLGMFTERVAVSGDVSLLEVTREIEARERAAKGGDVA